MGQTLLSGARQECLAHLFPHLAKGSLTKKAGMASPQRNYSPLAGFLSYLVPGLGQIYEGRVGKGVLFMVCLYGMFFFGMYLGDWKNVYLPDSAGSNPPPINMPRA